MMKKFRKPNLDVNELIDKYADTHYLSVDFYPNGRVNVWISGLKGDKNENKKGVSNAGS